MSKLSESKQALNKPALLKRLIERRPESVADGAALLCQGNAWKKPAPGGGPATIVSVPKASPDAMPDNASATLPGTSVGAPTASLEPIPLTLTETAPSLKVGVPTASVEAIPVMLSVTAPALSVSVPSASPDAIPVSVSVAVPAADCETKTEPGVAN